MDSIKDLKRQLAQIKRKEAQSLEIAQLKAQINAYNKKQKAKEFDEKHPVLGGIGMVGSYAGNYLYGGIKKFGKKVTTPLTPEQEKYAKANQKKLKELLEM